MSQPSGPSAAPEFQPPVSYGGYGGELQSFGQPAYGGGPYPMPPPTPPAVSYPAANLGAAVPSFRTPLQRPAVVALAATLAVTASVQWICVLSFCWLLATAGAAQLGTTGMDGGVYHILNRFNYRMLGGLAWPLYLFPLASFVLGLMLPTGRAWVRTAFTVTGTAAVLWSGWWLRGDLQWWIIPAGYIAISVLVLWTADTTRWYRRGTSDQAGQFR